MNELETYVASLQDQGLSVDEIKAKVIEWKKNNKQEVVETSVEPVKTEDGAVGASAPSVGPQPAPEPTELTLEDGFSVSPEVDLESSTETFNVDGKEVTKVEFDEYSAKKAKEKEIATMSFGEKLLVDFKKGSTTLGEMIASVPETIYDLFALPQNLLASATGLDIEASAEKFKEKTGLENPVLEFYEAESAKLQESQDIYNKANYDHQGIYKNFEEGNYADGFKQLASGLAESAPVSMSMMVGGAAVGTGKLAAGSTIAFAGPEIKEQREKNVGQSEAENIIKGLGLAGAESVFSSIGTGTIGKVYKDILIKEGKEEGIKVFRQGLVDMYRSALTKFGAPASMVGEGVEEVATTITQNMINGVDPFENVVDSFIQGVGGGLTYGAPINSAQAVKAVKSGITNLNINKELKTSDSNNVIEAFSPETPTSKAEVKISQIPGSLNAIDAKADKQVEVGDITVDQANDVKLRAREVQGSVNRLKPLGISVENQPAIVDLMIEQKKLKNTIKQVDNSSLTKAESERLSEIDKELNDIVVADKTAKVEEGAKVIAEQVGTGFETFENEADVASAIETLKEQGGNIDTKSSEDYGTFVVMPDGKRIIILNKESAAQDNVMTTAQHEVGHAVLFETVKNKPEAAIALGTSLLEEFKNSKDITFTSSRFLDRFNQYVEDADISKADTMEEVLTLASEGLESGDIVFNEKATTKIGDFIRRALSAMGLNVKFKTGRDVLNFVRDYNRSVQKGKGLSKGLEKAATKGAEVDIKAPADIEAEVTDIAAKESKKDTGAIASTSAQDLAVKSKSKEGLTKKEEDNLVEQVQLMAIEALGYKQGKGTVSRDKALGFVNDYIPGILRRFKPVKNIDGKDVPQQISTFVYRNIQPKQAKFYEQEIGTKSVETSISDERQKELESIEDTSKGPVAEVDTDVKLVDNIKIDGKPLDLPFKDKVRGFVTEQLKNVDINSEKFRKQVFKPSKDFVDFIVKDLIGNPKQFREFLNSNPTFYKGLSVTDLVAIDDGRVKKGQPRLFTEPNRRLTKQADIEKFMMQGRIPYLTTTQQKAGAVLYNRLKPKAAAIINNFFGSTPQNNSNRKRAIAKAIANKFIAEATPSTEAFKAKPQLDKAKIAERLQVSQQAKFSKRLLAEANIKPGLVDEFLKATSSKGFNDILEAKLKDESIKQPWKSAATEYFKENPIEGLDLKARRQVVSEISSVFSMQNEEVAVKRFSDKSFKELKNIIDESLASDLVKGYTFDTVDLITGDKTYRADERSLEGLNRIRVGVKMLVDTLAAKGFNKQQIETALYGGFITPANIGGFRVGKEPTSILLTAENLGEKTKTSRGSMAVNINDFRNNFLKGIPEGEKIKTRKETYSKDYWTNPKSKFNKLDQAGKLEFIQELFNEGSKVKLELADLVETISELDVTPEVTRYMITQLFADMSALGKRASGTRYVLTGVDGKMFSFKELEDLGLTRPGGDRGVFEHTKPANRVAVAAYAYARTGDAKAKQEFLNELETFDSALITEQMDDMLRNLKLQSKMGLDYKSTDNPMLTRYKEMVSDLSEQGVFFYDIKTKKQITPLEALSDGLVELEADDVQSIKEYKEEVKVKSELVPGKVMASKRDSDLIPDAIKYDRPISVKTAINALEKTDKSLELARKLDQPVKKIRVFDFDDTLARTKSNVLYTMPGESIVYNGSPKSFSELGKRTDLIFLATEIKEAQEYANSNRGEVKPITVNNNKIATEENVITIMEELGIATNEGLLYEMIDPRFEDFFIGKKNIDKVKESLKKNGYGGFKYEDGSQISSKGTESIAIIDKSIIKEPSKIDAATFAKEAGNMEAEGAQWDFSEFSKVMEGSKGPLLDVAKIIADKRGTKDVFVLTARPADAAGPIKEFLASMGLDIPLANITGLGDGAPEAKAGWIMGKAAEGYNDFYFADDHTGNVKAVKDVLSQIDVKSKVQLAKASKRQTFDTIVNDMIEDSSGIETYKKYSAARAKTVGANKGKYAFLIPPSAEDFTGLLYKMLGKGKKGDAQMAFLKTNLLDTYNRAESAVTQAKISAANDFVALKTKLKTLPKTLSKETGIGKFTYSHAVRVAAWTRQGMTVPGLSKRDVKELNDFVNKDAKLRVFTDELIKIQKGKEYPKPGKDWLGGNITTDIIGGINKVNRAEYQQELRENIEIIFSEDNMNKMEAAYGTRWREAIEDSIRRMKSGSNRPIGGNRVTEGLLNWLNNSVGAVMFLNTRSALLQTISAVNFINLGDNNIIKAGRAFANQKQFWGDFMTLMNSDYLVERRNGLKINVSESEIADAVRESKNKPKAAIAFLLSKGFVMTRFADSFAIASGGSTFYRNRLEALKKQGLSDADATQQAFEDFKAIAEENQQSSSPSKISQQQASAAGRVILAWANTPMQYARIQKRAAQDLINKRGDWKSNVSKIVYYGAIQNLIFNSLQQAVFALGFGDDEEETDEAKAKKRNDKAYKVVNGMIDSQLKGLGIFGSASVAIKNTLTTLYEEHGKKGSKYENAIADLLSFSPPLGSKIGKITGGLRSASWNKKDMKEKGFSLDNPAYMAGAQVVTGLTNVPLDRVAKKINNLRGLVNERSSLWQKVALGLGWGTWELGLGYYGGFDKKEPLTPKQELQLEVDKMKKDTSKPDQVKTLLDFGLTKKQIRELKNENNRVKKILELQKKDKDAK